MLIMGILLFFFLLLYVIVTVYEKEELAWFWILFSAIVGAFFFHLDLGDKVQNIYTYTDETILPGDSKVIDGLGCIYNGDSLNSITIYTQTHAQKSKFGLTIRDGRTILTTSVNKPIKHINSDLMSEAEVKKFVTINWILSFTILMLLLFRFVVRKLYFDLIRRYRKKKWLMRPSELKDVSVDGFYKMSDYDVKQMEFYSPKMLLAVNTSHLEEQLNKIGL